MSQIQTLKLISIAIILILISASSSSSNQQQQVEYEDEDNNSQQQAPPPPPQQQQQQQNEVLTDPNDPKLHHQHHHHHHHHHHHPHDHKQTVNNDNEHHKALYTQHHQHHQQHSTTSRVLELSDRFLDIVNNVLPPPPSSSQQQLTNGVNINGPEEPKFQPWLVKFYVVWCGHCKRLEPVFNHVAQALHNTPIRVGRVDCTRFPAVGNFFKIHGYPTIMFISGPNKRITFQGDRDLPQIVRFAKRMASPPITSSPLPLHKFLSKHHKQAATQQSSTDSPTKPDNPARTKRSEEANNPHNSELTTSLHSHAPDHYFGIVKPVGLKDKLTAAYSVVADKYHQHNDFYEFQEVGATAVRVFCVKSNRMIVFEDDEDEEGGSTHQVNVTSNLESWIGSERFPDFVHLTRSNLYQLFSESVSGKYAKDLIVAGVVSEDKLNRIMDENSRNLIRCLKKVVGNSVTAAAAAANTFIPVDDVTGLIGLSGRSPETYGWIGSPELANSIVAERLPIPSLLIMRKGVDGGHEYYVFSEYGRIDSELKIENIVRLVRERHFSPSVVANSLGFRVYRWLFDARVSLVDMWQGNAALTACCLFLPLGFLSLILYSVCCGDIMDAKEEEGGGEFEESGDDDYDGGGEHNSNGGIHAHHEKRE